jgi:site-specific recombinase XerD
MIALRFKPLKNGKFSAYLDIYIEDESGHKKRSYEFLKKYFSKDYSDEKARVADEDKEALKVVRAVRAKREVEIMKGEHGLKRKQAPAAVDFIAFVEEEVKKKKKNPDVNDSLLKKAKSFIAQKPIRLSAISSDWCSQFREYLLSVVSNNTTRSYLFALQYFLDVAVKKGHIATNPMSDVDIPTQQDVKRTALNLEELRLLDSTPTDFGFQLREAFFFSCFTGLRLKDVHNLKWSDIRDGKLYFRIAKTPDKVPVLPLSDQAQKILNSINRNPNSELVFSEFTINKRLMGTYLSKWAIKAGIQQHVHFHCARHTFATIAITYGIDVYTVQNLLVHAKMDMTQKYARIVDSKKVQEIAKLPTL